MPSVTSTNGRRGHAQPGSRVSEARAGVSNPNSFDAVKVFSATKAREREELGETVTRWLADQGGRMEVVDKVVSQSSDNEFHCLSIILFLQTKSGRSSRQ